jgi:hypothetical protein
MTVTGHTLHLIREEIEAPLRAEIIRLRAMLARAEYWLQCPDNERIGITWRQDLDAIRAELETKPCIT